MIPTRYDPYDPNYPQSWAHMIARYERDTDVYLRWYQGRLTPAECELVDKRTAATYCLVLAVDRLVTYLETSQ